MTESDGLALAEKIQIVQPFSKFTVTSFNCLDKKFYLIYFSILIYVFVNSIRSFVEYNSIKFLVVGIILSTVVALTSLIFILNEQRSSLSLKIRFRFYLGFYSATGLVIVISDPQVLGFFSRDSSNYDSSCVLLLFPFTLTGASYLVKSRQIYYFTSYSILILAFIFSWQNTKIFAQIITYLLLTVYIYTLGIEIKEYNEVENLKIQDEISSFRIKNPNTPFEEIIAEIHDGIEKILDVSKSTTPTIQLIYKKIIALLKNILTKIQKSDNIYQPRLDMVTKNMDEDDKKYIEEECFDNLEIYVNKAKRRESEQKNVIQVRMVEYGMSELSGFLRQIGKEWNFDTFFVAKCSKTPALIIGKYSVKMYGLDEMFNISDEVLDSFLNKVENGYPQNPYHNSTHGADVMCSYLYLLTKSRLSESMVYIEWLCGIIACLGHDIGHPGKNNRFLVMTGNELAIQYNDISVLENMHASTIFKIMTDKESNIFSGLRSDKYLICRKLIIELILATDMSKHFDLVSYMRTKYNEEADFTNKEIRADTFKLCIKSADVGHAAKSTDLHVKWCELITEEFFTQGDEEKKRSLPVSMYCDRETTIISKSQAGFIKNIVLSLYMTLNSILVSEEIEAICINQLKFNEAYWESLSKQRNLSSIHKQQDVKQENHFFPLIKRKTLRKGSLPPIYKSSGKF